MHSHTTWNTALKISHKFTCSTAKVLWCLLKRTVSWISQWRQWISGISPT